jgi:hypothetical protein
LLLAVANPTLESSNSGPLSAKDRLFSSQSCSEFSTAFAISALMLAIAGPMSLEGLG